jgi:hypothetical protein
VDMQPAFFAGWICFLYILQRVRMKATDVAAEQQRALNAEDLSFCGQNLAKCSKKRPNAWGFDVPVKNIT